MKMKNSLTLLVAAVLSLVLIVYMFLFQVRYDEVAVLTTFDRATKENIKAEPRLYLRLPWPIQKVTKYSTRLQVLDDTIEQGVTSDNYSVVVRTYLAWRIEDPLAFFSSLENLDNAEEALGQLMRDVKGIVGRYRFDQMVNTDAGRLQLVQIEQEALKELREKLKSYNYGITAEEFGIRRVVLPEANTQKVFDRMKATRQRMAAGARASGSAQAAAIRSEAQGAQQRILAFAERRAQAIRAQGDQEAARYYEVFNQNEQFAIFLRQVDTLKKILSKNTTFVLDANRISPMDLFTKDPGKTPATGTVSAPGSGR